MKEWHGILDRDENWRRAGFWIVVRWYKVKLIFVFLFVLFSGKLKKKWGERERRKKKRRSVNSGPLRWNLCSRKWVGRNDPDLKFLFLILLSFRAVYRQLSLPNQTLAQGQTWQFLRIVKGSGVMVWLHVFKVKQGA